MNTFILFGFLFLFSAPYCSADGLDNGVRGTFLALNRGDSQPILTVSESVRNALAGSFSSVDCFSNKIEVNPLIDSSCGYAPLCGTPEKLDPLTFLDENFAISQDMKLGMCCPIRDTRPTEDCQKINKYQSCRYVGTAQPFCNPFNQFTDCSPEALDEARMRITLAFTQSEASSCCQTCTCYGDPRCTSFNNVSDIWVLCDARTKSRSHKEESTCEIKKQTCLEQIDHDGNKCHWKRKKKWNVAMKGSQCVPNPKSSESWLLMYAADDFSFRIRQGERGVINKVSITMQTGEYSLTAEDCLSKGEENSWVVSSPVEPSSTNLDFSHDFIRIKESEDAFDNIWIVSDPVTKIQSKIRCTATRQGNKYGKPRINVEELVEPDEFYKTTRSGLDGFCYTDTLMKTGSTENTDLIESGEGCIDNGGETRRVIAARAICDNPSLSKTNFKECFESFCSANFFPKHESPEVCVEAFMNNTSTGFCMTVVATEAEVKECVAMINDFGWEDTAFKYNQQNNKIKTCAISAADYPKKLDKCQKGVLLQYLDDTSNNSTWTTYLAIPEDYPPCNNTLVLTGSTDYILFTKPIRLKQCSVPSSCSVNTCHTQSGLDASIQFAKAENNKPPEPPVCNTTEAPLCSTKDEYLDMNLVNQTFDFENIVNFSTCCSLRDTIPNECEKLNPEKSCRVSGTNNAICPQGEVSSLSCSSDDLKNMQIVASVGFQQSERETCCHSCTCYGDPRCTSFSGAKDSWIICDARGPISNRDQRCAIKKSVCNSQLDHGNNPCLWKNSKSWNTALQGSQCIPNFDLSGDAMMLMYSADSFSMSLKQGERGIIKEAIAQINGVSLALNAEACFDKEGHDAWNVTAPTGVDVPSLDSILTLTIDKSRAYDKIWVLNDRDTNIHAKIRCTTSRFRNSNRRGNPRLHIDDLVETNMDYQTTRENIGGFCHLGSISEKSGTTANTDAIDSGNGCTANNAGKPIEIARLVCNDPTITNNARLNDCRKEFCSEHYFPSYDSTQSCVKAVTKSWVDGFCKAARTDPDDRAKCRDLIEDFGWEATVDEYLHSPFSSGTICVNKGDLPKELTDCQAGVELQYQTGPDKWETYIAFPENTPICGDIVFNGEEDSKLFRYPIRFKQCSVASHCTNSFCSAQAGVIVNLKVEGVKFALPSVDSAIVEGLFRASCGEEDGTSDDSLVMTIGQRIETSSFFPADDDVVCIMAKIDDESATIDVTLNSANIEDVSYIRNKMDRSIASALTPICGTNQNIHESVSSETKFSFSVSCADLTSTEVNAYLAGAEGLLALQESFKNYSVNGETSSLFVVTSDDDKVEKTTDNGEVVDDNGEVVEQKEAGKKKSISRQLYASLMTLIIPTIVSVVLY